MEPLRIPVITEFDEETGEWEIADEQLDGYDEQMIDRIVGGDDEPMTEAEAIQQAIAEHVAGKSEP